MNLKNMHIPIIYNKLKRVFKHIYIYIFLFSINVKSTIYSNFKNKCNKKLLT